VTLAAQLWSPASSAAPAHRDKHNDGLPSTSLVGSFAKNAVSGNRPVNPLKDMFNTTRFCSANSGWRSPESWLRDTSSTPSRTSQPNSDGIVPQLRLTAISSPGILPMLPGIFPENELPSRSRSWSREHDLIFGGTVPDSRLPLRMSFVSEVSIPTSNSSAPLMMFLERSRYWSERRSRNGPRGSSPATALSWRSTKVRFRHPNISAGTEPNSRFEPRSRKLRFPSLSIVGTTIGSTRRELVNGWRWKMNSSRTQSRILAACGSL
jgi:hypothetical protein